MKETPIFMGEFNIVFNGEKFTMITLTELQEWQKIQRHYSEMKDVHLNHLFETDPKRFRQLSFTFENDILFDFSKNHVTLKTLSLLLDLAKKKQLEKKIQMMFSGEKINWTEGRQVLHIALRNRTNTPIYVNDRDVMPEINQVLSQIEMFSNDVRSGKWKGFTGKQIRTIINIGIGGSYLGPKMICEAMQPFANNHLSVRFISNIDGADFSNQVNDLNPEETLFIVSSKTFTTQETMTNAHTARKWMIDQLGDERAISSHFVAVSTNRDGVKAFGIDQENMFVFWDWVGGRYSWASSIGLSVACYIGFDRFTELLAGAHDMDNHFKETPLDKNIPVLAALIGLWYNNFFGAQTLAILPYDQSLRSLPLYLQQADMESNGKYVDSEGNPVQYQTGPIVWGETGTNGQHAFYQLLHQGTKMVPADFIGCVNTHHKIGDHHLKLMANYFAQTQALMCGRSRDDFSNDKQADEKIIPHQIFEGNRPTTSILINLLTPRNLGRLIAFYEMKIFVQGTLWDINSFDQWGVELGKVLAKNILDEEKAMTQNNPVDLSHHDSSSEGLLSFFKNNYVK
jgi:glucose-6-phosphate isomerase